MKMNWNDFQEVIVDGKKIGYTELTSSYKGGLIYGFDGAVIGRYFNGKFEASQPHHKSEYHGKQISLPQCINY